MKTLHKVVLSLATVGTLAAIPLQARPMGPGLGPDGGPGGCGTRFEQMAERREARMEQRLDALKQSLKIGAEQEKAWNTFIDTVKQQRTAMIGSMKERMQNRDKVIPAPERMEERISAMKQRLAGMETVAAAQKQLYAALTPEQKQVFDQHFIRGMGR